MTRTSELARAGETVEVTVRSLASGGAGVADLPDGRDWSGSVRAAKPTSRERAFTETWFNTSSRAAVYESIWACQLDFRSSGGDGMFRDGCFHRTLDVLLIR